MFYKFLKVLVRFVLKIFFRKIYITGLQNVDMNKAQLVSSNHPSGFLEPLIMACFFPKSLHFLVRGDIFDNPILKPILISTHQIPVFRFRDGFSKLRENSNSVDESTNVLLSHKNLLIFAEGGTKSIKQLRPLQKGISRIAFQSLEKNPELDLEILPVGINFTYSHLFNQEVMLKVGSPISLKGKLTDFQKDQKLTHEVLLNDVYNRMKENMIHLENYERLSLMEELFLLDRLNYDPPYLPVYIIDESKLNREKSIAQKVDALSDDRLAEINDQINSIKNKLKIHGLKLKDLISSSLSPMRSISLLIGLIPALIGCVANFVPVSIGYFFTTSMVKQVEFRSSILMISNLLLFLIYYFSIITIFIIFDIPILYVLVMMMTGFFWRYYYDLVDRTSFKLSNNQAKIYKIEASQILSKL